MPWMLCFKLFSSANDCRSPSLPCDSNAQCLNPGSGYQCQCNRGFTGNGQTCQCESTHKLCYTVDTLIAVHVAFSHDALNWQFLEKTFSQYISFQAKLVNYILQTSFCVDTRCCRPSSLTLPSCNSDDKYLASNFIVTVMVSLNGILRLKSIERIAATNDCRYFPCDSNAYCPSPSGGSPSQCLCNPGYSGSPIEGFLGQGFIHTP